MVGEKKLLTLMLVWLVMGLVSCRPREDAYDDEDDFDEESDELTDVQGPNFPHHSKIDVGHVEQLEEKIREQQHVQAKKPSSGSKWTYEVAEGCKSADCKYKKCALNPEDKYSCSATQYRDCSNETREKILTCANGMVFDGVGRSCSSKAKCESEPARNKGR